MSVREAIEKKPAVTAAAVGGVVVAAVVWSIYVLRPDSGSAPNKAYYSDDDGKTTFVDSIDRVPPFDHNGKTAVRALVYTIDDHRTSFVGCLERYTPEAARRLNASHDAVAAGKPATADPASPAFAIEGTEFKKPGDPKWLPGRDLQARQNLLNGVAPAGQTLDSVLP